MVMELDDLFRAARLGTGPDDARIKEWFKDGEYDDEKYLVQAIKMHLLTEQQKTMLFRVDLSIEDCLNGRYGEQPEVEAMYEEWNAKLGFRCFGF